MFKYRLVPVMVRLKPPDIKTASHCLTPPFAIRAANAPAVKPASIFTTAITGLEHTCQCRPAFTHVAVPGAHRDPNNGLVHETRDNCRKGAFPAGAHNENMGREHGSESRKEPVDAGSPDIIGSPDFTPHLF